MYPEQEDIAVLSGAFFGTKTSPGAPAIFHFTGSRYFVSARTSEEKDIEQKFCPSGRKVIAKSVVFEEEEEEAMGWFIYLNAYRI